jgi:tetratricopeptide (TPR) repeat protein
VVGQGQLPTLLARLQAYATPHLRLYLLAIPLLVLFFGPWVSSVWAQHAPTCPPDRTCILVASFTPAADPVAQEITAAVEAEVRTVVDASGGRRFTIRRVDAVPSAAAARQLAQEQRALLIVWGSVQASIQQLTIDFELTDLLGAGESTDVRDFRIEPQAYNPIDATITCSGCAYMDISQNVSRQARVIAYTAMGLLHYGQGWPEQARLDFAAALYCAGEGNLLSIPPPLCAAPAETPVGAANHGLLYYYLGRALQQRGDYALALDTLQRAGALNPADPATLVGMGLVYQRWLADPAAPAATAAFRTARQAAAQLLASTPATAQADLYYLQGVIAELLQESAAAGGHYAEAVAAYERTGELGWTGVSAYNALVALGRVQGAQGMPEAAQTLQRAIEVDKAAPWAYLALAWLEVEAPVRARDWLKEARQRAPRTADVSLAQAELCVAWADYDCAAEAYDQALQLRPGSGWLHEQVATFAWRHSQDREAALAHYRQALQRRPCDPWLHERLAFALGTTAQPAPAAWHYTQALRLLHPETAPDHVERLQRGLDLATEAAGGAVADLAPPTCPDRLPRP